MLGAAQDRRLSVEGAGDDVVVVVVAAAARWSGADGAAVEAVYGAASAQAREVGVYHPRPSGRAMCLPASLA